MKSNSACVLFKVNLETMSVFYRKRARRIS